MGRGLRISGTGGLVVCLVLSAVWANFAIAYQLPASGIVRIGTCLALDLIALAALVAVVRRRYWRALLLYVLAYAILLAWSGSISASNNKTWAADVAHGITGVVDGDRVSARNVRNFSWRTETDYTERWEERTYDLAKLRSLDLFLVYWMGPAIAHTIMSFGFEDGRHLDFSIELRRTLNDQYSALAGFFKTHELVYIGADERDLMTSERSVASKSSSIGSGPHQSAPVRCSLNTSNRQMISPHVRGFTIRSRRTAPPRSSPWRAP
jgi:hypothetical protein